MSAANWELLEAHRHGLTRFLRGKCPSEEDVEDCVQEAILRVAQLRDVDDGGLRRLLKTVAYNVAMDMHRDRRRQSAALARVGTAHPPAPEAVAVDTWEARRLAEHARRLSFRERAALRGRADGFAPQETAALIGGTPRSIHLALSRARTSLRRLAEAAGFLILWARRHGRRAVQLAAPTIAGMTVGLALLAPAPGALRGASPLPAASAPTVAEAMAPAAPTAGPLVRDLGPANGATPVEVNARSSVAHARPAPEALVAAHAGSRQVVEASAGVVQIDSTAPLLTRTGNCLKPGAVSLSGHHLGCTG